MAHSLLTQQQNSEMCEGMFEWKIERFLENDSERMSSVFKFGRHSGFLKLLDKSTKTFADTGQSRPRWANFEIELHILPLLGFDIFSKMTYYKACFMTCNGSEFFVKDGSILREESSFHMMLCYEGLMNEKRIDLLPEGTLTFRLTWYHRLSRFPFKRVQETQTPPDLIPEKEPTKLLLKLSEDLGRFYESKTDTDCVLKVGDVQILAHRAVLSARSEVFAAMFRHETSENRSGVVVIPDVDAAVLSDILYYVYSGQIRGLSSDTAAPMYVAADKYAVIDLRDACMDLLKRSLTIENVCDAAVIAHTHGEAELEEKVAQFMGEKLEEIEQSDSWKQFSNEKPSLAIYLLRSALKNSRETIKKLSSK